MGSYEDNELIKHKALANKIIEQVNLLSKKINKVCEKKADEIEILEKNISECEDLVKISQYSKLIDEKHNDLLQYVSIKNRMDLLIRRNTQRCEYLSRVLKDNGIYLDKVSKQDLDMMTNQEIKNISEERLNLNVKEKTKKYFNGELLTFIDGKLDLSLDENYQVLADASDETLHKIIFTFPSCVSTIGISILTDVKLKKKILKEISAYAFEESKTKNFKEINKDLGSILSFKNEITENIESFVAGVENNLNVKTCVCLANKNGSYLDDIKRLRCNFKSELVPQELKVAVLANGLAGEIQSMEEQLSEDLKINEQKVLNSNAINESLKSVQAQKEDKELQYEKEKQEQLINEELKQNEIENDKKKKEDEENQQSKEEIELLDQMLLGLKKEDD